MSRTFLTARFAAGATLLAVALSPLPGWAQSCSGDLRVDETLPTGSRWDLCLEQRSEEGVALSEIFFTAPGSNRRKVLREASLAQVYVGFDDDSGRSNLLADPGFGDASLVDLLPSECPNGTLLQDAGKAFACLSVRDRGYIYKYYGSQRQGYLFELMSMSQIGDQRWAVRWRFFDDGTIEPAVAQSGSLQRFGSDASYGWELGGGNVGVAAVLQFYWRLDFDIAGNGANDIVEEIEVVPANGGARKELAINRLTSETGRPLNPLHKRSWRVRDGSVNNADGHAVSYGLEPLQAGYRFGGASDQPWAEYPFYVTRQAACERLASDNAASTGCGTDMSDYVSGESVNSADVVIWYGITYHHLPRAEDQPFVPMRWQGFQLLPRDWTATNPLVQLRRTTDPLLAEFRTARVSLRGGRS